MKPPQINPIDDSETSEADRWQRLAILLSSRLVLRGDDLDDQDLRVLSDFFCELLNRKSR
ncbi:hypothetical protein UFOVP567_8 [uncultured Caudovirales phage]|uniref:Uncharacterized protein n=1 Tax=uncultured Caudovirales phage TaxID=2100421 RepID=A0A6J5MTS3_9CAUD|nr:hypothetical protein UFOVP567_8 [uncultured Caudovirales phage]